MADNSANQVQLTVQNYAGEHGQKVLKAVIDHCDLARMSLWRPDPALDPGNCLRPTLHAALGLISSGYQRDIKLVTGRFDNTGNDLPAYHAWLEFNGSKPSVVLNTSNIHTRPIYAINKDDYYNINGCSLRVQEIPLNRIAIKIGNLIRRGRAGHGENSSLVNIETVTRSLLEPTLRKIFTSSDSIVSVD